MMSSKSGASKEIVWTLRFKSQILFDPGFKNMYFTLF